MAIVADDFLDTVGRRADAAGVFGRVERSGQFLQCAAKASAAPAWFRIEADGGQWFVSLVTADRWLSESIEADLMHHGDPMEELIEEELAELDWKGSPLKVQHYRSEDKLYTFRSPLPLTGADKTHAAEIAGTCLLAYEAAFRQLGDMEAEEDEA